MSAGFVRRVSMVAAVAAVATVLPAVAVADTINVHPGNNPIQKAVNRAEKGDLLKIHGGAYPEDVSVDKRRTTSSPRTR